MRLLPAMMVAAVVALSPALGWAQSITALTTPGAGTYNVPANWNNSSPYRAIFCIGAGGNGSNGVSSTEGGAGGGGGAESSSASGITLTPSGTASYQVGTAAGTPTTIGASFFNGANYTSASCGAQGGTSATTGSATGGAGGSGALGSGTPHAGGPGGNTASLMRGGGGGGAGSSLGAGGTGGNGGSTTGGAGGNGGAGGLDADLGGAGGTATLAPVAGQSGTSGVGGGGGGGANGGTTGATGGSFGAGGGGANTGIANLGGAGKGGLIAVYYDQTVQYGTPASVFSANCSTTSVSVTLPNSVAANNSILISGAVSSINGGTQTITSFTATGDTCGASPFDEHTFTTGLYTAIDHCYFAASGSTTVTMNITESGTNCQATLYAFEYPPMSAVDVHANSTGTAVTTFSSGSVLTTNAADVLIANVATVTPAIYFGPPITGQWAGWPGVAAFSGAAACTGSGTPYACCTGSGTGPFCGLDTTNYVSDLLPQPEAVATQSLSYTSVTTSNYGGEIVAFQDLATPTATPTATSTATATATSTATPTASPTATATATATSTATATATATATGPVATATPGCIGGMSHKGLHSCIGE
jgi:hypothetical protein